MNKKIKGDQSIRETTGTLLLLIILSVIFIFPGISGSQIRDNGSDLKLWYKQPAANWNEALPIGNGSLGAMVFGGIQKEKIQLNEETIWTGKPVDRANPEAKKYLKEVRELLFAGKYAEAEKLAQEKIMGTRLERGIHTYQTLGDLNLDFGEQKNIRNYRRELDIENAVVRITYSSGKTEYKREIFSSAADRVIVVRITSNVRGAVSFTAGLSRPGDKAEITAESGIILMKEHVGIGNGVRFEAGARILNESGSMIVEGNSIKIDKADAVTIIIAAATDFRGDVPGDLCKSYLNSAARKTYKQLLKTHLDDYHSLFKRVSINLGETDAVYFSTNERLNALNRGSEDPALAALYFQFGRYLLISSSRPGTLPANLQGIWADGLNPPWNADYHININLQMNYWPAEVTNLSECHYPMLDFVDGLRKRGRITAKKTYGCDGFVAHHTTDVWQFTEPIGKTYYGMWPMGAAWSCQHLWEHYLFSENREFLKNKAYPIMKEAAEFFIDFLVEDPKTGQLVSGPSMSPENNFITSDGNRASVCMGPSMDHQIIVDLFNNCIDAAKILDKDSSFRKELVEIMSRIAPIQIGKDGRILEWSEEFKEHEPGHRHMSHLFALHPGKQITYQDTPDLMQAAKRSIEYRLSHGGGHTGWSRAWIINFFARLQDGEKAYENVKALLRKSTMSNLFDNHPPFQIDGNFGGCAGIAEMLLQSHAGEIHLLPALPGKWNKGSINGLCARGGFEVDISWDNGELIKVKIYSKLGNKCKIRYKDKLINVSTNKDMSYLLNGNLLEI
jgi:alpha-L-fucosidase 2